MEVAREVGRLSQHRESLINRVIDRLEEILGGLPPQPVLLHGDLWSGNYLVSSGKPYVIDPAVYYGEREMELAFMELFSGFPGDVFSAYRTAYPLDSGYERRRALHQLYPL